MTPVEVLGKGSIIPPGTRMIALPGDERIHLESTPEGANGSGSVWDFLEKGELSPAFM